MINLNEFFDGVQIISSIAIIAFIIFYLYIRKDIHRRKNK